MGCPITPLVAFLTLFLSGVSAGETQALAPVPEPTTDFSFSALPPPPPELDLLPSPIPLDPVDQILSELWMPPLLVGTESQPYIKVRGGDGKSRAIHPDETLLPGDLFQTAPKAGVRIAFDDGSEAIIGGDCLVMVDFAPIEVHRNEDETTAFRVPVIRLVTGEMRVLVPPLKHRSFRSRSVASPIRFVVQTPQGFAAVRGTDFVVRSQKTSSTIHVLNGVVEMATDFENFRTHQTIRIPAPYYGELFPDKKPPNRPLAFRRSELLSAMEIRQPGIQPLWIKAVHERKSTQAKVEKLRDRKLEETALAKKVPLYLLTERAIDGGRRTPGPQKKSVTSAKDRIYTAKEIETENKRVSTQSQGTGKPRHKMMDPHQKLAPPLDLTK